MECKLAVLDVAQFEEQGVSLLVVFVPPETGFFNDVQRARLRDLLLNGLVSEGLTGELLAIWESDGTLQFMGNPQWAEFLGNTNYTALYARKNRQITV